MTNKQLALCGIVMYLCSMFIQWFHWFLYEKLEFASGLLAVTPLALCMLYHFVRRDCGENKQFSYAFIFCTMILLPLVTGAAVTALIWLNNPSLYIFSASGGEYVMTAKDTVALYSSRIFATSIYLLVFSVINRFIINPLTASAEYRKNKK